MPGALKTGRPAWSINFNTEVEAERASRKHEKRPSRLGKNLLHSNMGWTGRTSVMQPANRLRMQRRLRGGRRVSRRGRAIRSGGARLVILFSRTGQAGLSVPDLVARRTLEEARRATAHLVVHRLEHDNRTLHSINRLAGHPPDGRRQRAVHRSARRSGRRSEPRD